MTYIVSGGALNSTHSLTGRPPCIFSHLLAVLPTTAASLLGHRRHGRVLNSCHRRSRRSFRRARLLRLNAEESVEEGEAEFVSAGEIQEKVERVVGAVENVNYGPEV